MIAPSEFQRYLQSICDCSDYKQWWAHGVLTDTEREQSEPFDFDLQVKEVKPQQDRGTSSENPSTPNPPLPVIKALHQYVAGTNHILLVGRPGAGKTKTLIRYLLELAKQALDDSSAKIPILVQLKDYKVPLDDYSGIVHLIRKDLEESWELSLKLEEIQRYLFKERIFLLLVDGLNELSASQEARKDIRQFRDRCHKRQIPIVFVTRSLGYRDLGVETQLEIQPISPADRQRFLEERVSLGNRQKLQGWLERARQSDYTPFVMWMLATVCQQANSSSQLESFSLGEAFREFVRLYQDRLYEEGRVSDDDCEEWASRLEHLASEMMTDERPENFVIPRVTAIEILGSEALLNNLVRHHLLVERRDKSVIEFCHQLLQEYYAAELLRRRLPDFLKDENSSKRFQHDYLNYLKWTEPIAIMLGLPEITEAVRVVELALDVDLILGARLAGEVKTAFQPHTVASTMRKLASVVPEEPVWLKLELLERIGSKAAVSQLIHLLDHPSDRIRNNAYFTLLDIDHGAVPEQCRVREDSRRIQQLLERASKRLETKELPPLDPQLVENLVPDVRTIFNAWVSQKLSSGEVIEKLNPMLQQSDYQVQWSVVAVLGSLNSEAVIPSLLQAVENPKSLVRHCGALTLGRLGFKSVIPKLIQIVKQHQNPHVRCSVVYALAIIGSEEVVPGFLHAMQDSDVWVCRAAVEASKKIYSEAIVPELLAVISHSDPHIRRLAAYNLRILSVKENIAKLLNEIYLQTLVQGFEHPDLWVRWRIAFTLWNVASEEVIPLLRPTLNHQNPDVGLSVALVLGKFGCKDAVPGLMRLMNNSNLSEHPDIYEITHTAAYALGQVKDNVTAKHLPELLALIPTQSGEDALRAISGIQAQCQFYNYEIYQQAQEAENLGFENNFIRNFYEELDKVIYRIQENPELRQNDQEDRLTIDIVNQLCSLGYDASHDPKIGGHVDLAVRKSDFVWLGEAKIYRGNNYLWEGFKQLSTRYSSGDSNQRNGGLLIYIFDKNASSIMKKWQNYLLEKSLPNYSFRPCEMRSLAFISTHRHKSSGQAFHVRHIPVMLHFAPKDKSGRRRKESP